MNEYPPGPITRTLAGSDQSHLARTDKAENSIQNKLKHRQARFGKMTIHPKVEEDTKRYQKWAQKKADLLEEIQHFENELNEIKTELKEILITYETKPNSRQLFWSSKIFVN